MSRRYLVLANLGCLVVMPSSLADVQLSIINPPERLQLGCPPGRNTFLTVETSGESPTEIWLASTADAAPANRLALSKVRDGAYQINLGADAVLAVLRSHAPAGEFSIYARSTDGRTTTSQPLRYTVASVPAKLDLPFGQVTRLTAAQRRVYPLPGAKEQLLVRLGDITAGKVPLSVDDVCSRSVLPATQVARGQSVQLPLAGESYDIRVAEMVNLLVGEDYVVLEFTTSANAIATLLNRIGQSSAVFVRNGQEIPADQFAKFLQLKWEKEPSKAKTPDEFIAHIATRSSTTGEPYMVKLPDGSSVPLADWLRLPVPAPAPPKPDQ